jgi:HK97 family phage prohead protease
MVVRTKSGEFGIQNKTVLLDFLRGELGMRRSESGIRGIKDGLNVELITPVPFILLAQEGEAQTAVSGKAKTANGVSAIPEGIAWTFSTFDLDRFDERIDPAGWEFKQFQKNPVIEWAHRYDIPAIGKAEGIYADAKGLHGSVVFNSKDFDPFGWAIGERVRNGVIRAGSVGFRILEIELPSKEDSRDGTALIFRKQELLEFSVCNVPANPFALARRDGESRAAPGQSEFWGGLIAK